MTYDRLNPAVDFKDYGDYVCDSVGLPASKSDPSRKYLSKLPSVPPGSPNNPLI